MKNFFFTFLAFLALYSCASDDNDAPIGSWLLIEQYSDPGDGSGGFVPVNSNKFIVFQSDGTIVSTGTLCSMTTSSDEATTGTYNVLENTITPDNCNNGGIQLVYEIVGDKLLLHYPCIEACSQKFRQVRS